MSITEFLLARIAEDEDRARAAAAQHGEAWEAATYEHKGQTYGIAVGSKPSWPGGDGDLWDTEGGATSLMTSGAAAEHIAAHDPARVLALCAALRAMVSEGDVGHRDCVPDDPPEGSHWCEAGDGPWPCGTVRSLARIWSAHPDFDGAWAAEVAS